MPKTSVLYDGSVGIAAVISISRFIFISDSFVLNIVGGNSVVSEKKKQAVEIIEEKTWIGD